MTGATYTPEELSRFLDASRKPGGVLTPDQLRGLIAWEGTPNDERGALESRLVTTRQQVRAERLAPEQRRGHVSLLDRIRHLVGRPPG